MPKTRVLVARVGPKSRRSGPRNVYVRLDPQIASRTDEIHSILGHLLRPSDLLIYPADSTDIVVQFAEKHGLLADLIDADSTAHDPAAFDLVVGIEPPPTPDHQPVASVARPHPLAFALKHAPDIYVTQLAALD